MSQSRHPISTSKNSIRKRGSAFVVSTSLAQTMNAMGSSVSNPIVQNWIAKSQPQRPTKNTTNRVNAPNKPAPSKSIATLSLRNLLPFYLNYAKYKISFEQCMADAVRSFPNHIITSQDLSAKFYVINLILLINNLKMSLPMHDFPEGNESRIIEYFTARVQPNGTRDVDAPLNAIAYHINDVPLHYIEAIRKSYLSIADQTNWFNIEISAYQQFLHNLDQIVNQLQNTPHHEVSLLESYTLLVNRAPYRTQIGYYANQMLLPPVQSTPSQVPTPVEAAENNSGAADLEQLARLLYS